MICVVGELSQQKNTLEYRPNEIKKKKLSENILYTKTIIIGVRDRRNIELKFVPC